ncbi:hypothetical protein PARC_a0012 [Pseudoalteromonas arctica A 37-1-2]|uniref:Uncharacterized protein n=1 Tax=Pseudoalteromonas arctica A 37-1-2 TaxID=1117313 RepID=A0A290S0R2_9GAMM|nr:hypothetical protein PARC_a0012 [Pseudoalteromonas arctica A 37-1-2]
MPILFETLLLQKTLFNNTPDHIITLLHACLIKGRFHLIKANKKGELNKISPPF